MDKSGKRIWLLTALVLLVLATGCSSNPRPHIFSPFGFELPSESKNYNKPLRNFRAIAIASTERHMSKDSTYKYSLQFDRLQILEHKRTKNVSIDIYFINPRAKAFAVQKIVTIKKPNGEKKFLSSLIFPENEEMAYSKNSNYPKEKVWQCKGPIIKGAVIELEIIFWDPSNVPGFLNDEDLLKKIGKEEQGEIFRIGKVIYKLE